MDAVPLPPLARARVYAYLDHPDHPDQESFWKSFQGFARSNGVYTWLDRSGPACWLGDMLADTGLSAMGVRARGSRLTVDSRLGGQPP